MEIIFEDDLRSMKTRVYLRYKRGQDVVIVGYDGENTVEHVLGPPSAIGEPDVKPLFVISYFDKQEFLSGCVNEASRLNMRNENENLLKGKLEATELHLNDMRDMSKKLLDDILKENIIHVEQKS